MLARLRGFTLLALVAAFGVAWMQAPEPVAQAHTFRAIAEGVYVALDNGTLRTGSNSVVIVNDDDVVVVDSHITPAAARALVQDIRTLTPKPIRYVLNTHYHFDHAHGNQVFGPGVHLVGHEFTRQMLLTNVLQQRTFSSFAAMDRDQAERIKRQLAAETDPARKVTLQAASRVQDAHLDAVTEIRPTPPDLTFQTRLTLIRGQREIQLLFLGRAHTAGDAIVYLPRERIICTGDMMVESGLPYMGDGFVNEWVDTLDRVLQLDFDTVLPGHGVPLTGTERIRALQSFLRDLSRQVNDLRARGIAPDEAAKKLDLSAHFTQFPQLSKAGVDQRAVDRIYDVLDGRVLPR